MFTKTLAATATAALVAAGSLGISTTSASAHMYPGYGGIYIGGPGYGIGIGYPVGGRKVCEPVFETQKVWNSYYGWTWTKVFVGNQCHWVSNYGYGW